MSHRVYVYNVSTPSEAQDTDRMMLEWGYEMPLLLQPLLVDGGFVAGNNYNNHTEPDNAGLYYNAQPGIENLKRFYDFLEKQEMLITNKEAFVEAKNNLFTYLDKLKLPYFHLDAWDVFNMDDTPHAEQAEVWLANIAHNNEIIKKAMENDDISLLNDSDLMDVSPGFASFAELLNYEHYQYGWGHIWQPFEEEPEVEIYEENGLWGLKDKDGKVLLQPQFDEFYGFGPEDLAVVSQGGKFGYVHKSGRIAIPLVWEDAYDFEYGTTSSIVKRNGQFGLIDPNGNTVVPAQYEALESLDYSGLFTAKKDGKWGVVDQSGSTVIDFEYDEAFENGHGFYHTAVKGRKNKKIFNDHFVYIGEFPLSAVESIGEGLLLVKPHKNANHSTLYKKDGTICASGFEKINRQASFPNMLVLRKGKKYGALGLRQESLLLPYEFDALIDMNAYIDSRPSNLVLAQKDGQKGVFDGDPDRPTWLFPLEDYQSILWLYENAFALKRNGLWCIAYSPENRLGGFEFDLVVRKAPVNGFAYAFKGPDVFVADESGVSMADKTLVLQDAEDIDYNYYFDANVRNRLLTYAEAAIADDGEADEHTSAEDLYSLALDACDAGDYEKAIQYDTIAAEKGYAPSMNNLAHMYYSVEGYLDDDKAFFWYEKGAEAGNAYAMNGLGICYQNGVGTAPDMEKALYWLGKAADNGLALAHTNMGSLYYEGHLVPQDIDKALWHYQQAEQLGSPQNGWLGYLHDLKGEYEKAFGYYQKDYAEGSDVGAYNLGICFSQGLGTSKDVAAAITYFHAALDREYLHAHIELARIYRNEDDFTDESLARHHIAEAEKAGLEIPDDLHS
ncbi:SEL1-like repeat protein [Brevibacillus borstelensis]|uniref:SEL1-like repeat protein n=1 Tax=Brevibacillus borstelensis TaxID=45462 RepID=UPI003CEB5099